MFDLAVRVILCDERLGQDRERALPWNGLNIEGPLYRAHRVVSSCYFHSSFPASFHACFFDLVVFTSLFFPLRSDHF